MILRRIGQVWGINITQHDVTMFLTNQTFLKTCHVTSYQSKNSNKNMALYDRLILQGIISGFSQKRLIITNRLSKNSSKICMKISNCCSVK